MTNHIQAPIAPAHIRYIKLGSAGIWEAASLDGDRIDCGFYSVAAALTVSGDWDAVKAHHIARGASPSTASGYVRELRDFYTLGSDTLADLARRHVSVLHLDRS